MSVNAALTAFLAAPEAAPDTGSDTDTPAPTPTLHTDADGDARVDPNAATPDLERWRRWLTDLSAADLMPIHLTTSTPTSDPDADPDP